MSLFMYLFTYLVYYFVDLNIYFCFQCHGKYLLRHFARLCGIRKLIGSYLLSAQNSLTTVPSCFQHIHDCLNTVLSDHRVLFLFVGHTPFARIFSASPFELCRDISRPTRGAKNLIEQTRGGGEGTHSRFIVRVTVCTLWQRNSRARIITSVCNRSSCFPD